MGKIIRKSLAAVPLTAAPVSELEENRKPRENPHWGVGTSSNLNINLLERGGHPPSPHPPTPIYIPPQTLRQQHPSPLSSKYHHQTKLEIEIRPCTMFAQLKTAPDQNKLPLSPERVGGRGGGEGGGSLGLHSFQRVLGTNIFFLIRMYTTYKARKLGGIKYRRPTLVFILPPTKPLQSHG